MKYGRPLGSEARRRFRDRWTRVLVVGVVGEEDGGERFISRGSVGMLPAQHDDEIRELWVGL